MTIKYKKFKDNKWITYSVFHLLGNDMNSGTVRDYKTFNNFQDAKDYARDLISKYNGYGKCIMSKELTSVTKFEIFDEGDKDD